MKFTIQPQHQDYFHETRTKMPWGYQPYISGQALNRRRPSVVKQRNRAIKNLLVILILLSLTIVARESFAYEPSATGELQLIETCSQQRFERAYVIDRRDK